MNIYHIIFLYFLNMINMYKDLFLLYFYIHMIEVVLLLNHFHMQDLIFYLIFLYMGLVLIIFYEEVFRYHIYEDLNMLSLDLCRNCRLLVGYKLWRILLIYALI